MGGGTDGTSYNADGNPNVLELNRNDDGRNVDAYSDNPDNQWNDNGAFAFLVPATNEISNTPYLGSVCFSICPNHPPSMRPISSNLVEIVTYFSFQSILFPRVSRGGVSVYRVSELPGANRGVCPTLVKKPPLKQLQLFRYTTYQSAPQDYTDGCAVR